MYKIKSQWYNSQTINSDLICQERVVWNLILDNKMDDVKAQLAHMELKAGDVSGEGSLQPQADTKKTIELLRKKIDKFSKLLYGNIEAKSREILSESIRMLREEKLLLNVKEETNFATFLKVHINGWIDREKIAIERPLYKKVLALDFFSQQLSSAEPSLQHIETNFDRHLVAVIQVLIEYMIECTEKKNKFDSVARPLAGNIYFY